jgi:hypothetical protein
MTNIVWKFKLKELHHSEKKEYLKMNKNKRVFGMSYNSHIIFLNLKKAKGIPFSFLFDAMQHEVVHCILQRFGYSEHNQEKVVRMITNTEFIGSN